MCGICGIHVKPAGKGKLPIGRMLDALLIGIEERGKEATGFISVSFDHEIQVDKAATIATEFIKSRKPLKNATQTVLGHTRLATQGPVTRNENNHPVQYNSVFVTHNGVIWNDRELFEKYGWMRPAEVDSVCIPALIHEEGFGNAKALEQLEGAMAIGAIDVTKPGEVMLAKGHSSPLAWIENDQFIAWASTIGALRQMWGTCIGTPPDYKKFTMFPEGRMVVLSEGVVVQDERFQPDVPEYGYVSSGWSSAGYTSGIKTVWPKSGGSAHMPTMAEVDIANTYADWAEVDNKLHRDVIRELSFETDLDTAVIEWLLNNANEKHILDVTSLRSSVKYIQSRYQEVYDQLLTSSGFPDSDCALCGDPAQGEKYCGMCSGKEEYRVGDTLKNALLTAKNVESLEEFVQTRQIERRQAIAELTTGSKPEKKKRARKKVKA